MTSSQIIENIENATQKLVKYAGGGAAHWHWGHKTPIKFCKSYRNLLFISFFLPHCINMATSVTFVAGFTPANMLAQKYMIIWWKTLKLLMLLFSCIFLKKKVPCLKLIDNILPFHITNVGKKNQYQGSSTAPALFSSYYKRSPHFPHVGCPIFLTITNLLYTC